MFIVYRLMFLLSIYSGYTQENFIVHVGVIPTTRNRNYCLALTLQRYNILKSRCPPLAVIGHHGENFFQTSIHNSSQMYFTAFGGSFCVIKLTPISSNTARLLAR